MGSDATHIFNHLRLHWISRAPPRCRPMVTNPVTIGGERFAGATLAVTFISLHSRILSEIRLALKTGISFEWLDTQVNICLCWIVVPHDQVIDRFLHLPIQAADRYWQ